MRSSSSTASLNSYDILKLVALAAMTLDHLGMFLLHEDWLRVMGRAAAPLFCFLVGFNGSYRFRKDLLVGAALMSIVNAMVLGTFHPLNILWSILLVRIVLQFLEKKPVPPLLLAFVCLLWLPAAALLFDYGTLVLLWALWGRAVARGERRHGVYYMIAAGAGTIVHTLYGFEWSSVQFAVWMAMLLAIAFVLQQFTLRPVRLKSRLLVWLSRHALTYYVAHRSGMMALSVMLGV